MVIEDRNKILAENLFAGSKVGALMRSHDWSQTPLGPVETWSPVLKTALSLLLNAHTPMFLIWGSDRILFYNDAYSVATKAQRPCWGQPVYTSWAETWAVIQPDIDRVFATGQSVQREQTQGPDENRWIWSYSPIWDQTDQINGVIATGDRAVAGTGSDAYADEREHQQCAVALQESEDRFHQMAETIEDVFWLFDPNSKQILYISPAYEQVWGRSRQHLSDVAQLIESVHPDDRDRVRAATARCIAEGSHELEYRIIRPDGSIRWIRDRGFLICDRMGQPYQITGVAQDVTERKRTEAALQENTAILNAINQTSPTLIYVKDRQGRIIMANPATVQAIGKLEAEIIGKTDVEFHLNPAEAAQIMANDRRIMETGQLQVLEEIVELPAGRRTFLSTKSPYRNAQGTVIGLIGISFDVTERKQVQEALYRSEERFQTFMDYSPAAAWISDRDGRILYLSQTYLRTFQLLVKEPIGKSVFDIYPTEFAQQFLENIRRAADTQEVIETTEIAPRTDGTIGEFLVYKFPISERPGEVMVGGVAIDITARRQTEAALQESEERYRYLAELIPQLVWTADADGILTDVNQRWSDFTGLTLAQAQAADWQAIVHPDDVPVISQHWAAAQQAGIHYRAEGRMRRADGAYRWHLHQAVPLKNEQGQVIKWFGTATDIEAQKQLENQRQRLLEQEQAAREQAEIANRIKDEFLAVLSHELRSPLNPILGWTKLLQARPFDPQTTKRALETIERNAKLQTQLIEDLLDVSRILRGKIILNTAPVDLAQVIQAAIETVRLAADAKAIQIQTLFAPEVGLVSGDSARLQQIIWNLLSNAVKFTPNGGTVEIQLEQIEIKSEASHTKAENNLSFFNSNGLSSYAQITVTDTGKGINPDFLPYVFDYFRQEDGKTTRQFGGLGLGLAIVRYLTELHGGTVKAISSGEGKGATFTVQLPLLRGEASTVENHDRLDSALSSDSVLLSLSGLRILVVDDEADVRELLVVILEQAGAIVQSTASAAEAMAALRSFKPDLLISDIGMPEVDGYMLIQQLRSQLPEQMRRIPAIALSAYAGELDQQQALAAGFQQHVSKPVEPSELVKIITALMRKVN